MDSVMSSFTPTSMSLQGGSAGGGSGGSAGTVEGAGFATTHGFTTTRGFSLPSGGKPLIKSFKQQQQQQQQKQKQQEEQKQEEEQKQQQQFQKQQREAEAEEEQGGVELEEEQQQQKQQNQKQQQRNEGKSSGLPAKGADSVRSCSSLSTASNGGAALAVRAPSDNTTGWRAMFEAARSALSSGVLGAVSYADVGPRLARIDLCCTAHATPGVKRLVKSVVRGLKACQDPERGREGLGGSYVCYNEGGGRVAIFKPCDEEPLAPNNPKGYVGRMLGDPGWKPTVRVGEAALREVAAYLLDHGHFARVPHTTLVRASHPAFHYAHTAHLLEAAPTGCDGPGAGGDEEAAPAPDAVSAGLPPKLGSLQEFVTHLFDTSELGTSRLSKRDIHRIGILDIRLFNTDRHAGNILVRNAASGAGDAGVLEPRVASRGPGGGVPPLYELVPIDHGFCLPEALEPPYFEWLHWPQAMLPFEREELECIAALDADADVALLRSELPALRPQCLRVLQVGTVLLQRCAAAGLTLAAIGGLMTRPLDALDGDDSHPSELERACVAARVAVETAALLGSSLEGSVAGLTLAEGEEGEEDDDSGAEEGGVEMATSPRAPRGASPASPNARGRAGRRPSNVLLFDLEGECDGSVGSSDAAGRASCDMAAPQSPFSQLSIDSLGSGGAPASCNGAAVRGGGPAAAAAPVLAAAGRSGPPPVARSVCAGFMYRPTKAIGGARTQSPRRALGAPTAYPPPVVAVPPRSTSEVLVGLDDAQWAAFMRHLVAFMDEQLTNGAWRAAASAPVSVAMSCPRF